MVNRTIVPEFTTAQTNSEVYAVRWSNDDSMVAAGQGDGTVRLYASADGSFIRRLNCRISPEQLPVTCLRWRPGVREELNNVLLCVTANGAIMHWLPEEGRELRRIVVPDNQCLAADFNPDGTAFAVGFKDSFIRIYDEETQRSISELASSLGDRKGHSSRIFSVKWAAEQILISGGWDNTVLVWDLRDRMVTHTIPGPHICGDALDCSGNHILTGSFGMQEQLQIWDFSSGRKIKGETLQTGQRPCMAYAAQFSKVDSAYTLAIGGTDECHFCEAETCTRFHVLAPIPKAVYSIDHANNVGRVAIGMGDGTVQVMRLSRAS